MRGTEGVTALYRVWMTTTPPTGNATTAKEPNQGNLNDDPQTLETNP